VDHTLISAIALDLGTTSIKAALMDQQGNLLHIATQSAPAIHSHHGCYESNALDYVEIAEQVLKKCLTPIDTQIPLGLCSQRSSFLIWNKADGQPITPLISWQDDRGKPCCDQLQASKEAIHELTGLRLSAYYFAPKLSVLLRNNPTWREKLIHTEWLTGTLDTFLIWRWTHGQHFITDASMAARTLLMDIRTRQWSTTLCQLFNIPSSILPLIKPSTQLNLTLDNGVTLQACVGDQSAALIASVTDNPYEALVNLGTGGFVIRYLTKDTFTFGGYLQTLVYQHNQNVTQFAIEGTLNSISAALASYPVSECDIDDLAATDIFCLAEPSGLGAPYFRNDFGIHFSQPTSNLTRHQIAALMLEAIIFRITRILEDFHRQSPLTKVYLSGGLSELICLQLGIAQCVAIPVFYLPQKETSLAGAALLASRFTIKYHQQTIEIQNKQKNDALSEKYQLWKLWLDTLLIISKPLAVR
jgi:glycerol kinase